MNKLNKLLQNKKDIYLSFMFFLTGILTRLPFIEKFQSHWDGPLYSIAVVRYSMENNTPPPPGYPLYITLGNFFYIFTHDPHKSILLVSVLFSGIGAVAFFISGKIIFNRITGSIASLIFLSGSTFYYFGLTPYSYLGLPTFWCLEGALSYLQIFKKKSSPFLLGLLFALHIGFRPQELMFVFPMAIFVFIKMNTRDKVRIFLSFTTVLLAWLIHFSIREGGIVNYFNIISRKGVDMVTTTFSIGPHPSDIELIIKGFFLSLGASSIFLIYYFFHLKDKSKLDKRLVVAFFAFWTLPTFLFNFFIVSVHAGYQMAYLSALILLSSYAIYKLLCKNKAVLVICVSLIVLLNLIIFFWNRDPYSTKPYRPTSFHYTDIRKNDLILGSKVTFIKKNFSPDNTLIITTSTLWSPYMYHLKDYRQYSIEAIFTENINYANQRRDSYAWITSEYLKKKREFLVPKRVENILIVDDEFDINYEGFAPKFFYLPGNSRITLLRVSEDDSIFYGYRILRNDK